jgi:tRNA pseudouridine38-40 synthase
LKSSPRGDLIPKGTVHYKVILAYNGSAFSGFQSQNGERTVQGEFETSLRKMGWQGQRIVGAGRTDAGVHAKGQVVSFELTWEHTTEDLLNALNYYLPKDMAAQSVVEVPTNFHPRYDAKSRWYRYHVICKPERDPLREGFFWRVWPAIDLDRMNKAAKGLLGVHDFAAFGSPMVEGGSTTREVFSAVWTQTGDAYYFDISANAYLYHMVRRMTYVLVTIGQGEAPLSLIEESLETGQLSIRGLAPAEGLVLQEVRY